VSQNEAYREIAQTWNDFFKMLAEANSQVILKALISYETLESYEKFDFDNVMTALMNTLEISLEAFDEEFIVGVPLDPVEKYFAHYFAYPGTHEWWRRSKGAFAPNVETWVDQRFPGPDPGSDFWDIHTVASSDMEVSTTT